MGDRAICKLRGGPIITIHTSDKDADWYYRSSEDDPTGGPIVWQVYASRWMVATNNELAARRAHAVLGGTLRGP